MGGDPHLGDGGGVSQAVTFSNLEPVVDLVAGPLVVNGTPAANSINYTQGSVAANGLVTIDNFESIEFSNKTSLTINALAGSDTINLNNPSKPTGLTGGAWVLSADCWTNSTHAGPDWSASASRR